jgi:hypothetical protein
MMKAFNNTITLLLLSLTAVFFVPSSIIVVDAATGQCEGVCVFNETMTCETMIETMEFHGDCCSLSDHPVTGNCVVTVSNGSCGWVERCATGCSCYDGGFGCVVPYTLWGANSEEACPASSYNISGTECTTPVDMEALCSIDTATAATDAPGPVTDSSTSTVALSAGADETAESSADTTFSRLGLAIVVAATATLVAAIAF